MQWVPAQLLSVLHFSSLPSLFPKVLHSLQPAFTRRTSGHCLGALISENLCFLR
jgi:hypothetical protein